MKLIILLGFLVPLSLASTCSKINDCVKCDSLLDGNGKQVCTWCESTNSCGPNSGLECTFGFGNKIPDQTDCPLKISTGNEYNEELSKTMMLLSAAAYADNPEVCLQKDTPDFKVLKQFTLICDDMGNVCSAFSAVSTTAKAIVLSFRGTIGDLQLLMEAEYTMFKEKSDLIGGGHVCKYFYDSFYVLWNGGVQAELNRIKKLYPTYELWVTGHSMGAALAAVASNVIVATKAFSAEHLKLITFGEPRVGDREFMIAHDNMIPYNYRVTHGRDLVTHIPPKDMLDYHHHRYEVWYNNAMNETNSYIVCLSPEDKKCSDQNFVQLSAMDHRFYFGIDVEAIIENGCHVSYRS